MSTRNLNIHLAEVENIDRLPYPQKTRFVSTVVNVFPALPMPGSSAEELVGPQLVQAESHYIILALNWTVCQHKRSCTSSYRIALSLEAFFYSQRSITVCANK